VFSQSDFIAALTFDLGPGNNGVYPGPGATLGLYPTGVPNSYGWKWWSDNSQGVNIQSAIAGRGPQLAGAAYVQVYNGDDIGHNPPIYRALMPNARIEVTKLVAQYYSISQKNWVTVANQVTGGAAFAEDYMNNEATGADSRTDANGYQSVRSGLYNAQPTNDGAAGGQTPSHRSVEDGPVGYNFHGFPDRLNINWADAQAIVISQAMHCVPDTGSDMTDCNKLGYIANVGIDSWATTTSPFDGFQTHGGVSGSRFKRILPQWQVFVNYAGPANFAGIPAPPVPQF
jgi:hypothetical protein